MCKSSAETKKLQSQKLMIFLVYLHFSREVRNP